MGEMIEYSCPNGSTAAGYLARPAAGEDAPGLVVIQEWWGLNEQIKGVGDRFAESGYRVLVPDLYRGRVTQDPDEAQHMMTGLDWVGATEQELRGALQYLTAGRRKAGVLGFCMGGALTLIAGVKLPEASAAVCFYGIPPVEAADPTALRVPFQGHFANQDDWCDAAAVNSLEQALKTGNVDHVLYRYDAQHGFFNEQRPEVYDANASLDAWGRSLAFLEQHL